LGFFPSNAITDTLDGLLLIIAYRRPCSGAGAATKARDGRSARAKSTRQQKPSDGGKFTSWRKRHLV